MRNTIRKIKNISLRIRAMKQYMEGLNHHVSYEEALVELEKFSPNPHTSCYCLGSDIKWGKYDLTVIIPSYNNEKFLPTCLDSIADQSTDYKVQVIVINDGSTDSTEAILEKYRCFSDWIIINQENRGFSGARNVGLDLAEGKYIMFVDSDDILGQNAIEKLMRKAIATDADIVAGNYISISFNGKTRFKGSDYKEEKVSPCDYLYGQPWGKVYKHEFFQNLRFPEGYWYEDSIFAQIMWPLVDNVYTIPDIVYKYRNNLKGISHTSKRNHKSIDSLYITEALLEDKQKFQHTLHEDDIEYFLSSIKLTYLRTLRHNGKIAKCIFIVWCYWFDKLDGLRTTKFTNLQNALKRKDFKKYILENVRLNTV